MNGLLDFIKTPEGQGLLSAAFGGLAGARRGQPLNSIGRAGLAGMQGYSGALDRQSQEAEAGLLRQQRESELAQKQQAAQQQQAMQDRLRSVFATPGDVNFQQLIADGVPIDKVKALAEAKTYGMPKVARTIKGMVDGKEVEYQVDDFGRRIGDGLQQYRAPLQVSQGDRQTFADPFSLKPLGSFAMNETPDGRASRAVQMRGQNMADARAEQRLAVDAATGGRPRSSGPMSVTLQKELLESDDLVQSSRSVVSTLKRALDLNDKAYSGYFAKGRAVLASNLGGSEAADATINIDNMMTGQGLDQMKSIFGAAPTEGERKILMEMQASADKTPKQREDIMKRAISSAERRAKFAEAKAKSIREGTYLTDGVPAIEPDAAKPETAPKPAGQAFDSKPPAAQYKGKTVRSPDGKRYQSDGMIWKEVK